MVSGIDIQEKEITDDDINEVVVEPDEAVLASDNIPSEETDDRELIAEAGQATAVVDDNLSSEKTEVDPISEESEDEPL